MTGLTKMSMCCMSSAETGNKVDVITLSSFTQTKSEIVLFFFLNKIPLCFRGHPYMSNCQSIVIKLMNFPTLLITTQNSNSLNQMS